MKKPDYYEYSSVDDPIGFFMQFFTNSGFKYYRDEFYTDEYQDDGGNWYFRDYSKKNMSIDEEYKIVTSFVDFQVGPDEWIQKKTKPYKVYFKNELATKLNIEFESSKKYFTEKIDSFEIDTEKITSYLKVALNSLVFIINEVKSNPDINKFQINLRMLYQIVDFLFKRYNIFLLESEFPVFNEAKTFLSNQKSEIIPESDVSVKINGARKTKKIKASLPITGFKWISEPKKNTLLLHDIFVKNNVISDDSQTAGKFEQALIGEEIKEPLKIEWLLNRGKMLRPKPVIVRIIVHTLIEDLELIEPEYDRSILATKLENIFVDSEGNQINNFYQALRDVKRNTSQSSSEYKIIQKIRDTFSKK